MDLLSTDLPNEFGDYQVDQQCDIVGVAGWGPASVSAYLVQ